MNTIDFIVMEPIGGKFRVYWKDFETLKKVSIVFDKNLIGV